MTEPEHFRSSANLFLQQEVYRLGSTPGLRSLPPGPSRDFFLLTWGPIVFRTSYAPETKRLLRVFLRCLNDAVSRSIHRVFAGSSDQLRLLEKTYASKVFSEQDMYDGLNVDSVRDAFHDYKVSLAIHATEATDLPSRLRACLMIDDGVLSFLTGVVDMSAAVEADADIDRCWVKVIEENFPDARFEQKSYVEAGPVEDETNCPRLDRGIYRGWTMVALSAVVEVFDGLRQLKPLLEFHREGRIYLGGGKWSDL